MKWLALAVLLTVTQVSPPIPGKAPRNGAGNADNITNHSEGGKEKTTASPVQDKESSTSPKGKSYEKTAEDGKSQIHAVVDSLPRKDFWDYFYIGLTALLVLIGAFTLAAVWYQAKEMGNATKVMRDSTEVAKRQASIMERQFAITQPHLHIDGVRVGWFREGQYPVFFVKIMNSGVVAAENVSISIKVKFANSTIQSNRDQVIVIPANSYRESFMVSNTMLDGSTLTGFDSGNAPLRVSGHVIWNRETTEYCYKYYPWPFPVKRPKGLRRFVSCDFDTTKTIGVEVRVEGNAMMVATGQVFIETEKPTPEPPKEPDKPN